MYLNTCKSSMWRVPFRNMKFVYCQFYTLIYIPANPWRLSVADYLNGASVATGLCGSRRLLSLPEPSPHCSDTDSQNMIFKHMLDGNFRPPPKAGILSNDCYSNTDGTFCYSFCFVCACLHFHRKVRNSVKFSATRCNCLRFVCWCWKKIAFPHNL